MAKPRPDLPNDVKSAKAYLALLAGLPFVERVLLHGSRSPLRSKLTNDQSDWDFVCVTEKKSVRIVSPRSQGTLHADVIFVKPEIAARFDKVVEIWPKDEYGVFDEK